MHSLRLTITVSSSLLLLAGCNTANRGFVERPSQALTASSTPRSAASPTSALNTFNAARKLAWDAAVMVQQPPHSAVTWQAARVKWRQAINLLKTIPDDDPVAVQAKAKLAVYQANYTAISDRLTAETAAAERLKAAQTLAWQAAVTVQKPPHSLKVWQRASRKWQDAIAQLEPIPPTTSAAQQSQAKLNIYRHNYSLINQRITTETHAISTLKQFAEIADKLGNVPGNIKQPNPALQKIGISYEDYTHLVQALQQSFAKFATQPDAKSHPVYASLAGAIEDYQTVLKLWKAYLAFKAANNQWLYDDLYNQLVPVSQADATRLTQKYDLQTYSDGTKVSLRFSAWAIWQKTNQHLRQVQQKRGEG
ncbi:hypothetical protein H6F76_10225 [Leptolyngbya sp. FACHB-321]|uniref:hypothetical protein n=1 Tax=Leptolyngbya sp. FACHB-321 TaxID=2692807 RepID=UPI001683312B|nr:hypothetical protein [Leptolyngbya sp. FACHB-321]MBD2035397.1 hypothetical protein [Leptolyngbya sp. FACHB-321]